MPKLNEIKEEPARYKITSEGTAPSYRSTLQHAVANAANRIGLGYKKIQITFLEPDNGES